MKTIIGIVVGVSLFVTIGDYIQSMFKTEYQAVGSFIALATCFGALKLGEIILTGAKK